MHIVWDIYVVKLDIPLSFLRWIPDDHCSHYEIQKLSLYGQYKNQKNAEDDKFPPRPPVQSEAEQIIKNFTKVTSPKNFEESGCAVCGALNLRSKMRNISEINLNGAKWTGDRETVRVCMQELYQCA